MSSDLATEVSQIILANGATFAGSTLVFYDHLITLDQEIRTVWQQKFSIVSLLIVSTRWILLLQAAFDLFPNGSMSCTTISWIISVPELVGFVQVAIFSALRVCAIWNQNYVLFTIVLILSLPPVITNAYFLVHSYEEYLPPPINACLEFPNYSAKVDDILLFVTRIPLIVADLLVLAMTWTKTYRQYREAMSLNIRSPLATRLIHDGTIYFFILLVLNITQIVSFYFVQIIIVATFTSIMPPVLICRFMMDLRLLNQGGFSTSESETSQQLASLRMLTFNNDTARSVMANIGEPLDYGQGNTWEDDLHVSNELPMLYFEGEPHT